MSVRVSQITGNWIICWKTQSAWQRTHHHRSKVLTLCEGESSIDWWILLTKSQLFGKHSRAMISSLDENQKISLLYWTSKQHKDPYKFCFIAGASHCYNKQIAVDLSLALKCIKIHFRNYCKVIQKCTAISFFWSVDNSLEFINKISDIKTAHSIKTFDFSTQYTNLPLDVISGILKSLIIKMFANSKSIAILVNSNRKKAFWSNGSSYPGYQEYTIDELLEALEIILFKSVYRI